jgi:hypothetical protein
MKFWIPTLTAVLFMTGCAPQKAPAPQPKVAKKQTTKVNHATPAPKKNIKLKEVEDDNFTSEYMYPTTSKKDTKTAKPEVETTEAVTTIAPASSSMSKQECISMIGQEKFDKYAQMYGGETAPLKKCKMLKTL